MRRASILIVFVTVLLPAVIMLACERNAKKKVDPRGAAYLGAATCKSCHPKVFSKFYSSAHALSSTPSDTGTVMGSFSPNGNVFNYDDGTTVVMQRTDSGLYQVAYRKGKLLQSARFDITLGLKNAQTHLYWNGEKTYELPLSYYTAVKAWGTSPGYSGEKVNFSRFIGADCFECHSSYIKSSLNAGARGIEETLNKNSLVYGIDCERCHGAGVNHVNYHQAYPEEKEAKYIRVTEKLTRQQKIDACAICHSGNDKLKRFSRFNFKTGDTLRHFFFTDDDPNKTSFDVHGNQLQLLAQSKCFIKSNTLTCTTCHDPHGSESSANITAACKNCHATVIHSLATLNERKAPGESNCISCHMPLQPSTAINFQLSGQKEKPGYMLHTHRIAIYGEKDKKLAALLQLYTKRGTP